MFMVRGFFAAGHSRLSLVSTPSLVLVDLDQLSSREPFVLWNNEESDDAKDGDRAENNGSEIEVLDSDWEVVWRYQGS